MQLWSVRVIAWLTWQAQGGMGRDVGSGGPKSDDDGEVEVGTDYAWVLKMRQLLRAEEHEGALAADGGLEELVRGLHGLRSDGGRLDGDELVFLVQRLGPAMHVVIEDEGLQGMLTVDQAVAIRLYTVEYPSVYSAMNGVLSCPKRREGVRAVSAELLQAVPFIRFLHAALKALPARFRYSGRCYRGIRHVFPSMRDHDVARHYRGKESLFFYEFKSASTAKALMVEDRFCGRTGARTIFEIDAVCGYSIEALSHFGAQEKEVLFPPLAEFKFVSCAQLCDPDGPNDLGPDIVVLQQVA